MYEIARLCDHEEHWHRVTLDTLNLSGRRMAELEVWTLLAKVRTPVARLHRTLHSMQHG